MIRRHMGEQLHDSVTVGDEQTPTCHCTVLGLVFFWAEHFWWLSTKNNEIYPEVAGYCREAAFSGAS